MQNIGDRLTEARKRLGLDLRQASEATKIRTDYLVAMEEGSFDFSLPEVYKKGFLKIYARYLKLDSEKLAADFVAQFSTSINSASRREGQENLGRVDAPGGLSSGATSAFENLAADQAARAQKQAATLRFVVYLAVAGVLLVLFVMLLQHMLQGSPATPETKPAETAATSTANTTMPATTTVAPPANTGMVAASSNLKLTFVASSDVNLGVWQESDLHQLFNGVLKKDQPLPLTSKGPVRVSVNQAQFLTIKVNDGPAQSVAKDGKPVTGSIVYVWPPQ